MTSKSIKIPVLNSLLYIRDPSTHDLPEIDGLSAVWSTPSCVAVSCLPDSEGATKVTLATDGAPAARGALLVDSLLFTPSHEVIVETVLAEKLLDARVGGQSTRVRVWTSGHRATDTVDIVLG